MNYGGLILSHYKVARKCWAVDSVRRKFFADASQYQRLRPIVSMSILCSGERAGRDVLVEQSLAAECFLKLVKPQQARR